MKLLLDAQGHAVLKDGHPVYQHDDGKEIPFDAPRAFETIKRLNDENKTRREAEEAANSKLKSFEGLDVEAAKNALETVKNLNDKKLVEAGEVEKVKAEAVEAFKKQLEETKTSLQKQIEGANAEVKKRDDHIFKLMVSNRFSTSKLVAEKLAVPSDMVESAFGANFKIEEGKVVGYLDGKKLYSKETPGEFAQFEEALGLMIEAYPHKDMILKGSGGSGSGSTPGAGGKKMTPDLLKMSPTERMNFARQNAGK